MNNPFGIFKSCIHVFYLFACGLIYCIMFAAFCINYAFYICLSKTRNVCLCFLFFFLSCVIRFQSFWTLCFTVYDTPQNHLHLALLTCLFLLLSALGLALYCTDRRRPQRACEELQTALAVYLLQFKQIVWGCWIWLTMQ